jgi:hypothetical protein
MLAAQAAMQEPDSWKRGGDKGGGSGGGEIFSTMTEMGDAVHYYACTATAIPFIYFFSGSCAASAPISTFMCL